MIPFLIVRTLIPIYLLVLLGLNIRLLSQAVNEDMKVKTIVKKFFLNYIWFLLIFNDKGREKLLSSEEVQS